MHSDRPLGRSGARGANTIVQHDRDAGLTPTEFFLVPFKLMQVRPEHKEIDPPCTYCKYPATADSCAVHCHPPGSQPTGITPCSYREDQRTPSTPPFRVA